MVDTTPDKKDLDNAPPDGTIAGRCFAYASLFRGSMTSQDVDEALTFLRGDQSLENRLRATIGHGTRLNLILEQVKSCQLYHDRNPRPTFSNNFDFHLFFCFLFFQ